jgi:hypothetical protein
MGTNYYWKKPFEQQKLHIGKSSYGWCFALHVIPELGINDLLNWIQLFAKSDSFIIDENKQLISAADMIEIITCHDAKSDKMCHMTSDCIGHGGSWDLIIGDFS